VHVRVLPMYVICPVRGTDSGRSTTTRSEPLVAGWAMTAWFGPGVAGVTGGVDRGVVGAALTVRVGVAGLGPGDAGVRVSVAGTVVRTVGVGENGRGVGLAVGGRVGVGETAAQPKSGVRQTPGVVPGVGRLQSAVTAQEKSAKSPPSQNLPVELQLPPGQCAARKQPNPRKSPAVHTF
jgi:hypothetical protein